MARVGHPIPPSAPRQYKAAGETIYYSIFTVQSGGRDETLEASSDRRFGRSQCRTFSAAQKNWRHASGRSQLGHTSFGTYGEVPKAVPRFTGLYRPREQDS